ncbi:MAG: LysM peptidoglycan-binding domain-containing protein [Planctomycetota bacterium]|jgi:hypothetical protein
MRIPPCVVVAACLASSVVGAGETGEARKALPPIPREVIGYVLSKVKCENPEYVCRTVGFDNEACCEDPGCIVYYSKTGFHVQDLGDGTMCYIFQPTGGNGSYAALPNYHFVLRDGRMRLLFDGNDHSSRYLERKSKVNGRYVILQYWRGERRDPREYAHVERTWFWNGRRYVWARGVTMIDGPRDGKRVKTETVCWNPATKAEFLSAPRSWTHIANYGDTLTRIARGYETDMAEIVRQNNIEDPNVIRDGQVLTYDSLMAAAAEADERSKP